ncbi:hypothetical protein IKQ21_02495 [bacterium]|nr:hypothetical protein [bacterium]
MTNYDTEFIKQIEQAAYYVNDPKGAIKIEPYKISIGMMEIPMTSTVSGKRV